MEDRLILEDFSAGRPSSSRAPPRPSSSSRHSSGSFRSKSAQSIFQLCSQQRAGEERDDQSDDELAKARQHHRQRRRGVDRQPLASSADPDAESGVTGGAASRLHLKRRASSAILQLYSNLQRRRSMSRLTPLSASISSDNGVPFGEDVDIEVEDEDEEVFDDDGDPNNNPLEAMSSYGHLQSTRTLKMTPSIVRRLPTMRSPSKYNRQQGRIRKRVIHKNGTVNLSPEHVDKRHRRYLQDMFTTMVDIRWRWNLLVFTMGFILSWFGFAVVWWLIAFSHADFEHSHDPTWTPCINNLHSFASAILFSIETQHTIGYGSRYTNEECPEAMFVMCLQSITGVMIQCFMVGFVFAKLSRPQKRSQTLMFSRHATTCLRDRKLCLMFRVGDLRDKSHIIGGSISAQVIHRKTTEEGEMMPYYSETLPVRFDNTGTDLFLIWPAIIIHEIDENSPFYSMNCEAMMKEKFEIVVILEGTVESTGQSVQARTSYLPSEILWGHRFEQLVRYCNDTGEYLVDYSKFNNTFPVDIAKHSGRAFAEEARLKERRETNAEIQRYHTLAAVEALTPTLGHAATAHPALCRPNGPSPIPICELLTDSQRERIKFYEQ